MKKILKWIDDLFEVDAVQGLQIEEIASAMNDVTIRNVWIMDLFAQLRSMNLEVDRKLRDSELRGIEDLCARRKAFQDVLESILSAKRRVAQPKRPNPQSKVSFTDLDRVTA